MKKIILLRISCFTFFSIFNGAYSQNIDLKKALDFLNNVRTNPNAYSSEIGVSLIDVNSTPPLRWNINLAAAAQRKAQDMADRNYMDHIDPDGFGMNYFINNAGYHLNSNWLRNKSLNNFESLSAGTSSPLESIIDLIKDEGVIGYGHRQHLLGMVDFWKNCYDIGIGWAYNPNSTYKTYCCVLIAKHDWNSETQVRTEKNRNIQINSTPNFSQNYSYNNNKTIEPVRLRKTKQHKLISLKIGGSVNMVFDDVKRFDNLNSALHNQLSYQLNSMIGVNLSKSKKNTTLGLFCNYGKYNQNNTTLLSNNFFSSSDNIFEIEGGLLIKEFLRLSGGLGYSSFNSMNLRSNNYTSFSAGFSLGPQWLKVDIINTLIIPKNNQKIVNRPSLGLSFAFNFVNKKF